MRAKKKKRKIGFTIIELLTVMSIIVILISLLVPSLNAVRRYSRVVTQKGQFHDIHTGLEMFSIDFDGYPNSDRLDTDTPTPASYCGAMKLCEAMLGQDGVGFHPDSKFYRTGWSGPASSGTELYPDPVTNRRERKNPYIDIVGKYKMCNVEDLYLGSSTGFAPPFDDPCSTVISDVFYRIKGQVTADKLGMPILYYKADIGKLYHDPCSPDFPEDNIYDFRDNDELAGLIVPDRTDPHPLYCGPTGDPDTFYRNTASKKIGGITKPYNEDSYILISAGWDGLYGTRDDVYNFAE
jgi:type II secretory pathway pseudopilin PulG